MSIKEQIRAEIERMREEAVIASFGNNADWLRSRVATCVDLLAFLDTLPEQPVLPGADEEGIPGKDFIPVEWVESCEKYGRWKIVQKVKSASDDLEEEIERRYDQAKWGYVDGFGSVCMDKEQFTRIARHFAEWGAEHLKR